MNQQLKENKQILRTFMRDHYTDDRLTQLLDHARSGKLSYYSCCCFIGIVTANHANNVLWANNEYSNDHYFAARQLEGASAAEKAFCAISFNSFNLVRHNRFIIPIVLAEIQRRQRLNRPVILPEAKEASPCIG